MRRDLGERIERARSTLADSVAERVFGVGGGAGHLQGLKERCRAEVFNWLPYVAESLSDGGAGLFPQYVAWTARRNAEDGLGRQLLARLLVETRESLDPVLGADERAASNELFEAASRACASGAPSVHEGLEPGSLSLRYVEALLEGDRPRAFALIESAREAGTTVAEIYVNVLQPALEEVGRRWSEGAIDVAQEHYVTAATELLMSKLHRIEPAPDPKGRLLAACVPGETHALGLRMITDLLELEGWTTMFLGGDVPVQAIVAAAKRHHPDVVALSASLHAHVEPMRNVVAAIRADAALDGVRIMVGGRALAVSGWRAADLGADLEARSSLEALETIRSLHQAPRRRP